MNKHPRWWWSCSITVESDFHSHTSFSAHVFFLCRMVLSLQYIGSARLMLLWLLKMVPKRSYRKLVLKSPTVFLLQGLLLHLWSPCLCQWYCKLLPYSVFAVLKLTMKLFLISVWFLSWKQVQEVVLSADMQCEKCQKRVADIIAKMNGRPLFYIECGLVIAKFGHCFMIGFEAL